MQRKVQGYYLARSSVTSSFVMTMCSGTSWKTGEKCKYRNVQHAAGLLENKDFNIEDSMMLTSCSVMLISSSCCRNCSSIYLGAMSTRDCEGFVYLQSLPHPFREKNLSLFYHVCFKLMFTCFAEGVMPIWTTMIARVMFSSCILWQYILIVLIPTLGSSEKKLKKKRVRFYEIIYLQVTYKDKQTCS